MVTGSVMAAHGIDRASRVTYLAKLAKKSTRLTDIVVDPRNGDLCITDGYGNRCETSDSPKPYGAIEGQSLMAPSKAMALMQWAAHEASKAMRHRRP